MYELISTHLPFQVEVLFYVGKIFVGTLTMVLLFILVDL